MANKAAFKVGDRVRHKVVDQTGVIEDISTNLLEVRRDSTDGIDRLMVWSKLDAELILPVSDEVEEK